MIGPHIISDKANIELLRKWNPPVITLLDPNKDYLKLVKSAVPNSKILVRIYVPDNDVSNGIKANPIEYARYSHQLTLDKYGDVLALIDYIQVANEVLQHGDELTLLTKYELERMQLADKSGLYKCGIYAFSVGSPDISAWTNQLTDALKYANNNNHCVVVHQYSKPPSMWTPDPDWHIHRLEHKVLPLLKGYNNLKFIVSEYGLDDLLYGNGTKGGYKKFISADTYAQQLIDIGKYIYEYSDKVLGYSVFTLGTGSADWVTYDISGEVEGKLANYYSANPVVPKWRNNKMSTYQVRVTANSGLNVRNKPNTTAQIIESLPNNTVVEVTDYNNEWLSYKTGYISKAYTTTDLAIVTNDRLAEYANSKGLDKYLLQALANIESGSGGFLNNRLLIRVEAHLLLTAAPELNQFFSFNPTNRFFEHYFNGAKYHGNQNKEWEAFDFARRKHPVATYNSTSYGKFQILGSNYVSLGFKSAEELFMYLNQNEDNHYTVFFRYLENFNMIEPLKAKDFKRITAIYNGPGNVANYSKLLEDEYNRIKPKGETVLTPIIIPTKEVPVIIKEEVKQVTEQQYNDLRELVINNSNTITELLAVLNKITLRLDNVEAYLLSQPDVDEPKPELPVDTDISNTLLPYFNASVMQAYDGINWKVKCIFTTANGSWDVSSHQFSIEQKYRDMYLKSMSDPKYLDKGGADHSIGFITEDKSENRLEGVEVVFASNGVPPIIDTRKTDAKGHGDFPLWSGQNFALPARPGPWTIAVGDAKVTGLGMYENNHISIWVVFEKQ